MIWEPKEALRAVAATIRHTRGDTDCGDRNLQARSTCGVGQKEQREYEHIKESAEESGRYGDRAAEVAARTALKRHRQEGHGRGQ